MPNDVPGARAAALDSTGTVFAAAGATLFKVAPDGSILSASTPVANANITSVAVDAQDRAVIGVGGFVARPPDFLTFVGGLVLQVAVDRAGNIWATTGSLVPDTAAGGLTNSPATLVRLANDGTIAYTKKIGGASVDTPSDLTLDSAESVYVTLVTNSAELPADGFQTVLNGIPGAVSYDGGGYFYL